jgi:hypothetical protein
LSNFLNGSTFGRCGLFEREPPFSKGESKLADALPPNVARAPSSEVFR